MTAPPMGMPIKVRIAQHNRIQQITEEVYSDCGHGKPVPPARPPREPDRRQGAHNRDHEHQAPPPQLEQTYLRVTIRPPHWLERPVREQESKKSQ